MTHATRSEETQRQEGGRHLRRGAILEDDMNTPRSRGTGLPALTRPDGAPVRVLVVDDDPDLAEVLSGALRYEGWEVRTAGDGASAVTQARELMPDAVILDVMLPDTDGFSVLRTLHTVHPEVCVLFLTARDAVEDRIAGITAGGDDYVTKPFSLEEVVARLRGLLRAARAWPGNWTRARV